MKARYCLFGCLVLAACDEAIQLETAGPVTVSFAQPFPAEMPDLPGFLPRHRGQYTAPGDTGGVFVLAERALVHRYAGRAEVTGAELGSLRIPRRAGSGVNSKGQPYSVQLLAADSFRLRLAVQDTVLNLTSAQAPRLRYYRG
jgi:hypothetical protein